MDKRPFAIYRTVEGIDIDALYDRLGRGITGKEEHHSLWHALPDPILDSTPTSIVKAHHANQDLNQHLLVIADHPDLADRGLLIVNLSFSSLADALRQKVYFASDFVPSVNVGNTSWSETLANATLPLYPRRKFAVFAHENFHPRYLIKEVLEKMNAGVGGRRKDTGTVFGEWEPGEGKGDCVDFWRENAREREWDGRAFVVVRKEAWEKGRVVLLVEAEGGEAIEEVEVEAEEVGDVLVWLFVGFVGMRELTGLGREGGGEGLRGLLGKLGSTQV
ncbi:MAG: hypothetical protein OHK93_003434 [Ramalina farinacea]|uniref:Uncharacterized protein n=1 Tax=Ramalina farinacea TaxID=258253 RepID=A0AA43QTJ6_9LECA|nr:hypothetical protein [Ramalina farinacea]